MNKKIEIGKNHSRAGFVPDSYNAEDRTIEVVFSTGAKGERYSYSIGRYIEELSMKKEHVDLERLNLGAPVLDNHSRSKGLGGILGVVEKAFIRNKEGIALIRFSEREEVQGIIQDIQSGVIRNVSIGYNVRKYEDVSKKKDEIPTYRAVDWEIFEVSFVDIPFDKMSQSRSKEDTDITECIVINNQEKKMNKEQLIREACKGKEITEKAILNLVSRDFDMEKLDSEIETEVKAEEKIATEAKRALELEEEKKEKELEAKRVQDNNSSMNKEEAIQSERKRALDIKMAGRALDIKTEDVELHIERGTSADEFRAMMIETKAKLNKENKTNSHNVEASNVDTKELRKLGAINALMNRNDSSIKITEEGKEFQNQSLTDLARNIMISEGQNVAGMTPNQISERAMHTSSDFKNILADVASKSLRSEYDEAPQTFGFMTREVLVNDFKDITRTQLGDAPVLEKVGENGEYKHGTISDSAEKYSLETFGKIITISRKTIVNDDLAALTRLPAMFGRRARDLESEKIYSMLASNPIMADGFALFSAEHGNLSTNNGPFDVARISEGREAMRLQTGLDGLLLDIMPKHLLTPVALETLADQFLGATVPQLDGSVNPFKNKLTNISEPRLDKVSRAAWYLAASTGQIDMIEIARLAGEAGPTISTRDGFERDGMQLKMRYDFAAKVIDHRGFYKNNG